MQPMGKKRPSNKIQLPDVIVYLKWKQCILWWINILSLISIFFRNSFVTHDSWDAWDIFHYIVYTVTPLIWLCVNEAWIQRQVDLECTKGHSKWAHIFVLIESRAGTFRFLVFPECVAKEFNLWWQHEKSPPKSNWSSRWTNQIWKNIFERKCRESWASTHNSYMCLNPPEQWDLSVCWRQLTQAVFKKHFLESAFSDALWVLYVEWFKW